MSRRATAVLFLGVGFILQDVFMTGVRLGLARWEHRVLRADEL